MKLEQSFEVDAPLERVWEALIDVVTDFTLTGRLARFGRGGMNQDVSNRLLRDFAGCLQSSIEAEHREGAAAGDEPAPAPPPAEPVGALALFFGALLDRLRRLFRG
jgi:hypothetical protein